MGNGWQYKEWVSNIARNMRITHPTGDRDNSNDELGAVKDFIQVICDPDNPDSGSRPWLKDDLQRRAVSSGDNYKGILTSEPVHVLVEMLEIVGRDLDGPVITDTEESHATTLIGATGDRRYGTSPYYGGTSGSNLS